MNRGKSGWTKLLEAEYWKREILRARQTLWKDKSAFLKTSRSQEQNLTKEISDTMMWHQKQRRQSARVHEQAHLLNADADENET